MTVLDDFGDLMLDTVTVENLTGRDAYGRPAYGAPTSVAGRHSKKNRLVRRADGSEVVSSSMVTLPPVVGLTVQSRVTVNGEAPPILTVSGSAAETGEEYYARVYFQ